MIDQTLTTPPTAPSSNDIPTFRTRFDAFLAWIVTFVSQLTTVISQINSTATTINLKEASAISASDAAVSAANFQGTYTNQTTQVGESYLWNGIIYKVLVAGNTSPTTTPTNWLKMGANINGVFFSLTSDITIEARLGTIASAATTTIGTAGLAEILHVTLGTTPVNSLGIASRNGVMRTLIFDGIMTLTHNATSLILPDGASITTSAGDSAEFICEDGASGYWRCVRYTRAVTPTSKDLSYKNTPISITSWSYSGTTITLNVASHTFVAGDYIEVSGLITTTFPPNGIFAVTSVTSTTIVYTALNTPTGTAGVSSAKVNGYVTVNGRVSESIGVNQTWQDVTASRVSGTTYTNTTGKPIMVIAYSSNASDVGLTSIVNGVTVNYSVVHTPTYGGQVCTTFIIPNGNTYSVTAANGSIAKWSELR